MTEEMRSRLMGMMMARVSRGVFPQREPIGYLYGHVAKEGEEYTHEINGTKYVGAVAPKLPDTEYQYAVICKVSGGYLLDTCSERPVRYYNSNSGDYSVGCPNGCNRLWFGLADDSWGNGTHANSFSRPWRYLFWTNTDIYSEDGKTLCFEAIDPIPIYE